MPTDLGLQPSATELQKHVTLQPLNAKSVIQEVEKALHRVEQIDAKRITAAIDGKCVLLRGDVKTWREHQAAAKAAAEITGEARVQNELRVAPWLF